MSEGSSRAMHPVHASPHAAAVSVASGWLVWLASGATGAQRSCDDGDRFLWCQPAFVAGDRGVTGLHLECAANTLWPPSIAQVRAGGDEKQSSQGMRARRCACAAPAQAQRPELPGTLRPKRQLGSWLVRRIPHRGRVLPTGGRCGPPHCLLRLSLKTSCAIKQPCTVIVSFHIPLMLGPLLVTHHKQRCDPCVEVSEARRGLLQVFQYISPAWNCPGRWPDCLASSEPQHEGAGTQIDGSSKTKGGSLG
jgi:hypothetical protein